VGSLEPKPRFNFLQSGLPAWGSIAGIGAETREVGSKVRPTTPKMTGGELEGSRYPFHDARTRHQGGGRMGKSMAKGGLIALPP